MTTHVQRTSRWVLVSMVCLGAAMVMAAPQTNFTSPPVPPMPKSPVDGFRELLAMKPAEREQYFTNRTPEARAQLEAKIREYESLTPDVRDARLRATQLHWYLSRVIPAPASNMTVQLGAIPENYRSIVSNRLSQFQLLPPPLQKDVLAHPTTAGYFLGRVTTNALGAPTVKPPVPPPLDNFGKMSAVQREKLYESFARFYEMSAVQRSAVLARMAPADRAQVEKVLLVIERLPADQREHGLKSIGVVVTMNEDQQSQLLRNAERWKELPPAERQVWTNLVRRLPPLPPGVRMPPVPVPPEMPIATNPAK